MDKAIVLTYKLDVIVPSAHFTESISSFILHPRISTKTEQSYRTTPLSYENK